MATHELLSDAKEIRVYQQLGRINATDTEKLDSLVLLLPEDYRPGVLKQFGNSKQLVDLARQAGGKPFVTRLDNDRHTLVVVAFQKADMAAFEALTLARNSIAQALTSDKPARLGLAALGFTARQQEQAAAGLLSAALAAGFRLPAFKTEAARPPIHSIRLLGLRDKLDTARIRAEANGNNLARWLTGMPPNKLDAAAYTAIARSLARAHGWQFKRYSPRELENMGAGAFLAVAQGNADNSAGILRLRYRPKARSARPAVSLVGKGIIFDTGGNNLKPFQSMLDMHGDMQGSAVALGTFVALSELKVPFAVDCWFAVTENRIGPTAYKSQDLVTALNGKTIQTIHTDAEGRMALADTLTLASRDKPAMMIDYATLTGAAMSAVTTRYSAIFSNQDRWYRTLRRTGVRTGERVWPFPVGDEFLEDLESPVADLKQCSPSGFGDHILAASFLREFVENDTPWIHIDLAAGMRKGGLGHIPTDFTGFGVRYTLALVLDEKLQETSSG